MRLSSILLLSALGATIDSLEDHPIISRHLEWIVGQTVHTQSGPIGGRGASSATQVSTYLGIPYAKSPIGNLRFAPPERFESSTPISGSKFVSHSQHFFWILLTRVGVFVSHHNSLRRRCSCQLHKQKPDDHWVRGL